MSSIASATHNKGKTMTYYNESQHTVGHAEDCLYEVMSKLPKDDPRVAVLDKMLIELSDIYHSFAVDQKAEMEA
jgi:hypothetical protein